MVYDASRPQTVNFLRSAEAALGARDMQERTNIMRDETAARTQLAERAQSNNEAYRAEQIKMQREEIARQIAERARQQDMQESLVDFQNATNIATMFQGEPNEQAFRRGLAAMASEGIIADPNIPFTPEAWDQHSNAIGAMVDGLSSVVGQPNPLWAPKPDAEVPSSVQALQWRAQEAGLQPGSPEYRQFIQSGGKMAEGFAVTLPDGTQVAQGNIGNMKFTEGQAKDNVFVTRAEGALSLLDSVGAGALTSRLDRGLDAVPFGLARGAQSEDFQVAQQSGDEFLQAILRKDTGAAITEGEQELYGKTYLPQPGDGARVIEAKRQSRIRAVEALKSGMNMQQLTVSERANVEAARRAEATKPAGAQDPAGNSNIPPAPEAVEILKSNPTDEYKRFFDEVFGAGAAERALSQ